MEDTSSGVWCAFFAVTSAYDILLSLSLAVTLECGDDKTCEAQ